MKPIYKLIAFVVLIGVLIMTLPLTPCMGGSPFASSTNAPSFVMQVPEDMANYISPGMRVRLKQGAGYLYFLITKTETNPELTDFYAFSGSSLNFGRVMRSDGYINTSEKKIYYLLFKTDTTIDSFSILYTYFPAIIRAVSAYL